MLSYRGFDRGSMITGSSVHNQRIERLWRDMFRVVIFQYYKLFYSMEANNILNPLNDTHLFALHYTYTPHINRAFEEFHRAWNFHGLSSEKNKSPLKLFTTGIAKLQASGRASKDFFISVDDTYGIDFCAPEPPISEDIETAVNVHVPNNIDISLLQHVDVLRDSDYSAIDIYLEVLAVVIDN